MSEACCIHAQGKIAGTATWKSARNRDSISKARHFLECVILEQRAATEELKASNCELERLLEEVLSSRSDLRSTSRPEEADEAPPAAGETGAKGPERRRPEKGSGRHHGAGEPAIRALDARSQAFRADSRGAPGRQRQARRRRANGCQSASIRC